MRGGRGRVRRLQPLRVQDAQGREQRIGESGCGDLRSKPGIRAVAEQIDDAARRGQGNDGQAGGGSFKQRVRHALVTGRKHKERGAAKAIVGILQVPSEVDRTVEAEGVALGLERGLFGAGSGNEQVGV